MNFTRSGSPTPITFVENGSRFAPTTGGDTSLDHLNITTFTTGNGTLGVTVREPGDPDPPTPGPGTLSYIEVTESLDPTVSTATFDFTVSVERVAELRGEPTDVVLYHRTGSGWEPLSTDYVGQTGDRYRYRASSDSLSLFAVRVESAPALSVDDVSLVTDQVTEGEPLEVEATVANDGTTSGQVTLDLLVDGRIYATKSVSVGGLETVTVSFQWTLPEAGTYSVAIGAIQAGDVTVVEAPGTSVTVPPDTPGGRAGVSPTPIGQAGDFQFSPYTILVVIGFWIAVGLLLYMRHSE